MFSKGLDQAAMPSTAKHPLLSKIARAVGGKVDAWMGRLHNLDKTLGQVDLRPPSLNLEFTNLCNANCTFCGYQHQERAKQTMTDEVFAKALSDYAQLGGGDVYLTPIVGDALIDKKFLDRVRALRAEPSVREI